MDETKTLYQCFNCSRSETEIPLVSLRYVGTPAWICTQCLPTLIHQPYRLADKLAGAENLPLVPPHEH